jgi:membrane associated rhomboid family serine protease
MKTGNILRRQFAYSYHNVTLYLIIANLIVFMIMNVINGPVLQIREGYLGIDSVLSMVPLLVNRGFVWQFFTYMFAHASLSHLIFNMLGLLIFGTQVEREMGSKEFLLFYLINGVLAGVLSYVVYLLSGLELVHLLGASGALYAVMLAFATYYPNARLFIWGILPVRSVTLVLGYAAIAVFSQLSGAGGGVAHMTHLGGFIFAFLYFLIRFGHNPIRSWRNPV